MQIRNPVRDEEREKMSVEYGLMNDIVFYAIIFNAGMIVGGIVAYLGMMAGIKDARK